MKIYITTKDNYKKHNQEEEKLTIKTHDNIYFTKKYKDGFLLFDTNNLLKKELEECNPVNYLEIKEG